MIIQMSTQFNQVISKSRNPEFASLMLILSWIAASDSNIDQSELEGLIDASSANNFQQLDSVLEIAKKNDLDAFAIALKILQQSPQFKHRPILELASVMALSDKRLTGMEGQILRLLADALSIQPSILDGIFVELTGQPFPAGSDPSSKAWWQNRDQRKEQNRTDSESQKRSSNERSVNDIERIRDLAFLGLEEDASEEEIRAAYRRMCKVHHPDRYAALGEEAIAAAEITFKRVKVAYERLVGV